MTFPSRKLMKGQQRLIVDTILLGVVGALSAQLFTILLHWSEKLFMTWLAGYHLLPAAALTVILSYLIQVSLSGQLKYGSLCEAQVRGRADSPTHHLEHLEAAIHLLHHRRVTVPESVSHLDLRALLASGIALDLPDGRRLALEVLEKKSPFVNCSLEECFPRGEEEEFEVVAVFRQGQTLLPHSSLFLRPGDRLLLITTEEVWKKLESHLVPPAL